MKTLCTCLALFLAGTAVAEDVSSVRLPEQGPETLLSETCAKFRQNGVQNQYHGKNFEFFKVAYIGCSWLSQSPILDDEEHMEHTAYVHLAETINGVGDTFSHFHDREDPYWLSENGAFLIAREVHAVEAIKWAYNNATSKGR